MSGRSTLAAAGTVQPTGWVNEHEWLAMLLVLVGGLIALTVVFMVVKLLWRGILKLFFGSWPRALVTVAVVGAILVASNWTGGEAGEIVRSSFAARPWTTTLILGGTGFVVVAFFVSLASPTTSRRGSYSPSVREFDPADKAAWDEAQRERSWEMKQQAREAEQRRAQDRAEDGW